MVRRIKRAVDAVMAVLLLRLMAYRPGVGLLEHGVMGVSLLALFALHNFMNRGWYRSLSKGRYNAVRTFYVAVNLLLFVDMLLMAASSVMLSGMIFYFSPFRMTNAWREVHSASTAWGFVLICAHIGLHTSGAFAKLERKLARFPHACGVLYAVLVALGAAAFARSTLWRKMLLLRAARTAYAPMMFYVEYIAIAIAICVCVRLLLAYIGAARAAKKFP